MQSGFISMSFLKRKLKRLISLANCMVKFYGVICSVTPLFLQCCSGLYLQIDELFEYVEEDVEEDPANEA